VARKVVTIVFADLVGSTSLHERLDAESARRLMDHYYQALHTAVGAHGGTVVKLLGDGVMAAFGVPHVAEDDAIRAVRAAVGMQQAFRDLAREQTAVLSDVGLRVAVNTGEVVVSDDHTDVVGDPVNIAARLQQEAHDGEVLIGESTRRLVSDLVTLAPFGDLTLKGRSETVAAYRVVSLDRPAGAPATAFVGRDDELRRIMTVYDTAVAARGARLAVILGSPGLGKSRLLDEFARRLGDGATVLTARCDAAGGATFAPLASALRALLRFDDGAGGDAVRAAIETVVPGDEAERARIAAGVAALLAGAPASPEETFFVVRRFLAALATAQPVVLAIDDLQWAEPLLLDLTEHLVQWSTGVPLLVLVAARPELRDVRSSLASSRPSRSTLTIAAPPARRCSTATRAARPHGLRIRAGWSFSAPCLITTSSGAAPRYPTASSSTIIGAPTGAGSRASTSSLPGWPRWSSCHPTRSSSPSTMSRWRSTAFSPSPTPTARSPRAASSSPSSYNSHCTGAAHPSVRRCSRSRTSTSRGRGSRSCAPTHGDRRRRAARGFDHLRPRRSRRRRLVPTS
jgi:class 3 adenylate cyclase